MAALSLVFGPTLPLADAFVEATVQDKKKIQDEFINLHTPIGSLIPHIRKNGNRAVILDLDLSLTKAAAQMMAANRLFAAVKHRDGTFGLLHCSHMVGALLKLSQEANSTQETLSTLANKSVAEALNSVGGCTRRFLSVPSHASLYDAMARLADDFQECLCITNEDGEVIHDMSCLDILEICYVMPSLLLARICL